MIAASALFLATATFAFGGGSDFALTKELASQFKQSVVLLAGTVQWPAIKASADSRIELIRVLRNRLQILGTNGLGVAPRQWPVPLTFKLGVGLYPDRQVVPAPVVGSSEGGSVVLHWKEPHLFDLNRVSKLNKPLRWHWYYESARFVAQINECTTNDFLQMLADAAGATLVERKEEYYLDLDVKEYRRRSFANGPTPLGPPLKGLPLELWFRCELIRKMSDRQIADAMSSQDKRTRLEAPSGSSLFSLCMKRVQWKHSEDPSFLSIILAKAGEHPLVYALFHADGGVSVGIRNPDTKWGILL